MADQPASTGLQQSQDAKLSEISSILQSGMSAEQKTAYASQKELEEAVSSLPPMTDISTGALTEIDLPVFQTAKKEKEQVVNDDAFANMANFEDEE